MAAPGELLYDVRLPRRPDAWGRLLIVVRGLLMIPHMLMLVCFMLAMVPITLAAWFAILLTGRYPPDMWMLSMGGMAWIARISAFLLLLRHEYVPFRDTDYGVRFEMWYPGRQSRLLLVTRWVLALPHLVALLVLWLAVLLMTPFAWISLAVSGRYPRPLFGFCVGVNRWTYRVVLYLCLLTDLYPAFAFGPAPMAPGQVPVPRSWAISPTS